MKLLLEKLQCQFCLPAEPTMQLHGNALRCRLCDAVYPHAGAIPSMLTAEEQVEAARFVRKYDALRLQEGWASDMPDYYLNLPFRDLTAKHPGEWCIRAAHAEAFLDWLNKRYSGVAIDILDVGAGAPWLARLLRQRGHRVVAVDLNAGPHGLRAIPAAEHGARILQARAEKLPFLPARFDIVIFSASLHYSADVEATLWEAWRALRSDGFCAVLDTPVYRSRKSLQAARERSVRYYARNAFPDISRDYHPVPMRLLRRHPFFRIRLLRRDAGFREWLRKRLRDVLGLKTGAYFPVLLGEPIDRRTAQSYFHLENAPRVTNRAAVIIRDGGRIALMRRQVDFQAPYWVLPGGRIEKDERALDAAVREVREEIGLDVEIGGLFATFTFLGHREHIYLATRYRGTLQLGGEELDQHGPENFYEPQWVALQELPEINFLPEKIARAIISSPELRQEQ